MKDNKDNKNEFKKDLHEWLAEMKRRREINRKREEVERLLERPTQPERQGLKIMKNKTYLIQTEDRYGRSDEYEVQASNKAEAKAIANKPANVINGDVVINVIEL